MRESILRGFSAVMILLYFGIGAYFIIACDKFEKIGPFPFVFIPAFSVRIPGILIVLYAAFRAYQFVLSLKKQAEDEYDVEDGE
ncbi:MAG: hypothetical protein LWX56_12220 [Ignavibacteria bacterium]|nr:hypothetical protein [Ignavibacteria bacterium]